MHRFASIDLGTNTCNLLLAGYEHGKLIVHTSEKRAIKLLRNSPAQGVISDAGIALCIDAVVEYKNLILKYEPDYILANATSGVRSASNGLELLDKIEQTSGIHFTTISGTEEANLIFEAVKRAVNIENTDALLVDIGGGSIEFILYYNNAVAWKQSFDIGISRVLNTFGFNDPLINNDMGRISQYFDTQLTDLYHILEQHNVKTIIGSSGTFETLSNILMHAGKSVESPLNTYRSIEIGDFKKVYYEIINSDFDKRMAIKGMEPMRVELIPLASWFVNYLVDKYGIELIIHSRYSLKEGAIFAFIEKNNLK